MPRPRLHDDALRTRLLEVTSAAVSRHGASATTVREVARDAGTSASAVYALFGSKDALVDAVRTEAAARFAAHLARPVPSGDAGADLLALGLAYRSSALEDPHFYRVMFDQRPQDAGPADGPDAPVTEAPTFALLQDAVARVLRDAGVPAAVARASALEPALQLWGLVHGLVSLELSQLMPGSPEDRSARFTAALRAAGPALLSAATGPA